MMHAPMIPDHPRYQIVDHEVVLVNERKKPEGGAGGGAEITESKSFSEVLAQQSEWNPENQAGYTKLDLNKKSGFLLGEAGTNIVDGKSASSKESGMNGTNIFHRNRQIPI